MIKKSLFAAICALALAVAARAELIPTGQTRIDPLPTIVAAPGEVVTLEAWVYYRVKDTEASASKRYKYLPLAKVPVEFVWNIHVRKETVGTDLTGSKGKAAVEATVDEAVKSPKNYTYWAVFQGGTYKPQGKRVYLKRSSDSGRLEVR